MIKQTTFIVFFLSLCGFHLKAQENNNYLWESVRIVNIAGNDLHSIRFKVNNKGIPEAIDQARFKGLVDKIVAAVPAVKEKPKPDNTAGSTTAGNGIPQGGGSQPDDGTESNTPKASADDEKKKQISKELAYVLFIYNTDSPEELKKIITSCPKKFYHLQKINTQINILQSQSVATKFSFPEAQILYGIVDLTISRAKEQMVETYLSRWYEQLQGYTFTRQMLPRTLSTLKAFNKEQNLNLAKYGDKWKAAFQEDLRGLPDLLGKENFVGELLDSVGTKDPVKKEIKAVIAGGSQLISGLTLKKNLVTVIAGMSENYLQANVTSPAVFKKVTVLTDILLKAGGTLDNKDAYSPVPVEDIEKMDEDSWKTFFKLLYVRNYQGLKYAMDGRVDSLLKRFVNADSTAKFARLYRQSLSIVNSYQKAIKGLPNDGTAELSFEETRKVFDLCFQLADQTVSYLPLITGQKLPEDITITLKNTQKYYTALSEIAEGIANRRYGAVVDGTAGIVTLLNKDDKLDDLVYKVQRYGSFMVNIINAKDAEEVKSALDELVPKNLYKLKNSQSFSVSLSSYPGIIAGYERISKYPEAGNGQPETNMDKKASWAFAPAVYLPIGFDMSFGNRVKGNSDEFNSFNIFLQLLDLGAVLNYRVTGSGSDEASDPNISFKQVVSPGLGLMFHLNNSPFVFGAATNYTPSLRKVSQAGNEYKSSAFRIGVFVAIDVTYFNLFTSKKRAK